MRYDLQKMLPVHVGRNEMDYALWYAWVKPTGKRVWWLERPASPSPVITALTVSLATPESKHGKVKKIKSTGFSKSSLVHLITYRFSKLHRKAPHQKIFSRCKRRVTCLDIGGTYILSLAPLNEARGATQLAENDKDVTERKPCTGLCRWNLH